MPCCPSQFLYTKCRLAASCEYPPYSNRYPRRTCLVEDGPREETGKFRTFVGRTYPSRTSTRTEGCSLVWGDPSSSPISSSLSPDERVFGKNMSGVYFWSP